MTTLFGIETNYGPKRIILASDNQLNNFDDGSIVGKRPVKKLFYGDSWAIGYAGVYNKHLKGFLREMVGSKNHPRNPRKVRNGLERSLEKGFFKQVRKLNTEERARNEDLDDLHSFVFAVRRPSLQLHWIDEYGNVKGPEEEHEFDYICLGSADNDAEKYIRGRISRGETDPERIDFRVAMDLMFGVMRSTQTDFANGSGFGISYVVLTKKGVYDEGSRLNKKLKTVTQKHVSSVVKRYSSKRL